MATSSHNRRKAQKKADRKAQKKADRKAEKKAERKAEKKAQRKIQKKLTKLANRKRRSNRKINKRPSSGFFNFIKQNKLLVIASVVLLIIILILVFAVVLPNIKNNSETLKQKEDRICGPKTYLKNKDDNSCSPCKPPSPNCDKTHFYDSDNPPYCRDEEPNEYGEKEYPCQPCPTCPDGSNPSNCGDGEFNKNTKPDCSNKSGGTSGDKGMPGGAIAAIVISIVVVIAFLLISIFKADWIPDKLARLRIGKTRQEEFLAALGTGNPANASSSAAAQGQGILLSSSIPPGFSAPPTQPNPPPNPENEPRNEH